MAGHDDRALDVRRIEREVRQQSFAKTLHRKFCGAIGGMRPVTSNGGPEAVDAAGIDDVTLLGVAQQWQKGTGAVIDAVPADPERSFPFGAVAVDKAAAATDPGIVEQQMNMVGVEIALYGLGESQHLVLDRHIGRECRDARALPRL